MLRELYPRGHTRILALPVLGPYAGAFTQWLLDQGYRPLTIRLRLAELPRVDQLLQARGANHLKDVSAADLVALAPQDSQDDIYLAATVRSLARCFTESGNLVPATISPADALLSEYRGHLDRVRGCARSTCIHHLSTAAEFLSYLKFEGEASRLLELAPSDIEGFLKVVGPRLSRGSLQHTASHLRSFLRYLFSRGLTVPDLDRRVDSPRLYRGERLPRSLPWETVKAFLAAIDRLTPMGKRDFAMFLLVATYGLRSCEIASLRLEDIQWRASCFRVPRSKVGGTLILPMTEEVSGALVDYLRNGRPELPLRQVFLRARGPKGILKPTAVTEAFQGWARRSGLPITFQGPHCLRHSLAVHLLRQGTPLKTIGDLLGHRSTESTCVYLRLNVEDLRDVALQLPHEEVQP